MEEKLVEIKTAKLAKEKGFDEPSFYYAVIYWGEETPLSKKDNYHAIKLVNGQIKEFRTTTDNRDDSRDFERNGLSSIDTLYITPENYTNYLKSWLKDSLLVLPTQALLQKWLREIHSISILVDFDFKYTKKENKNCHYFFCIYNTKDSNNIEILTVYDIHCETYEEALEKGLYEALTLIPKKNDNKGKE
jgi:hypothetical protein